MGAKYSKHHKDSDEVSDGAGPMAKAKALLLFSELYSEDSSDAISTPSCTSVEDVTDRRLNWNKEIPALHNLEEGMMQAKQMEDMKQAKIARKARGPSTWSGVEASDLAIAGHTPEGRQIEEGEPIFQNFQDSTSSGKKKSKGQSSTGSEASSGGSSFLSLGGSPTRSKNRPGIQLK